MVEVFARRLIAGPRKLDIIVESMGFRSSYTI
jgi:hypothetical protein